MKAAALAGAIALAACRSPGDAAPTPEPPPPVVTCAAAVARTGDQPIALRGRIAPPPRAVAVVAAPGPGRVARVLVDAGDAVVAGQVLAVLDDPGLGTSTVEAAAELAAATAALQAATAERTRRAALVSQGIAPAKDLDEAIAREAAARAAVTAATARHGLARGNLARAELRAPRAGVVLRVRRTAGEFVDGGDPAIVELADLTTLELAAQLTGGELLGLTVGAAASVVVDARPDLTLPAAVVAVAPALDPTTGLGAVRVRLTAPPPDLHLAVGLPGVATVHRAAPPAIAIPAAAVRRSLTGSDEVLVCTGQPAAALAVRAVTVGAHVGDTVEVTGVAAGERVVIDHVLALEDGTAVTEAR